MATRRSGRRTISAYKRSDFIEYQYKGNTVTGKLLKKAPKGTAAHPVWVVTPSDRRRKNEEIPEKALGKIIDAEEAMNNRAPKLNRNGSKPSSARSSTDSPTSSNNSSNNSDAGSSQEQVAAKRGSSDGGSPSNESAAAAGKRKGDGSSDERASKNQKTVTFSQNPASTAILKKKLAARKKPNKKATAKAASHRIGTRSTRGASEAMILLPDQPRKATFRAKQKKIKKDENVTVVKMLTGTLYMYRGDRPRAEFVRTR